MGMRVLVGWMVVVALAGSAAAEPGDLSDIVHSRRAAADHPRSGAAPRPARRSRVCASSPARARRSRSRRRRSRRRPPAPPTSSRSRRSWCRAFRAPLVRRPPAHRRPAARRRRRTRRGRSRSPARSSAPAWTGNALFLFFDLEDPESIENRQFTALYQAPVKAGAKVAARVSLSPEDGFRAGHTYRIRVVQLINGKEIVLGRARRLATLASARLPSERGRSNVRERRRREVLHFSATDVNKGP